MLILPDNYSLAFLFMGDNGLGRERMDLLFQNSGGILLLASKKLPQH